MEDIVTKLYQWGLPYVVERVFSYLDYSDIKNAILVSSTWSNILNDSEVNVWKALWERNMDQVPAWSLLYKRAICQQSCKLRNDPDWNFREACHFIGDAHQQLLFNWRHGICKEKWEVTRGVDRGYCGISATKVVKPRLQGPTQVTEITNKITIHDRWCLDENGVEIDTNPDNQHSHIIPRFEMNEQYLVITTAQGSVSIWNLERNEKLHEFSPPLFMDSFHCAVLNVRFNNDLLIMCTLYKKRGASDCQTVVTSRQMPTGIRKELEFRIVDQVKLPNFRLYSMHLKDERIVGFDKKWTNFFIVSINPFRLVRLATVPPLTNPLHPIRDSWEYIFGVRPYCAKYWNGWLLQNENGDTLRIRNVDTGKTLQHQHDNNGRLFDFAFVKNKIVTFWHDQNNLTFDVWSFPDQAISEEKIYLLYTSKPISLGLNGFWLLNWRVAVDDIQIWVFLTYMSEPEDFADFIRKKVLILDFAG